MPKSIIEIYDRNLSISYEKFLLRHSTLRSPKINRVYVNVSIRYFFCFCSVIRRKVFWNSPGIDGAFLCSLLLPQLPRYSSFPFGFFPPFHLARFRHFVIGRSLCQDVFAMFTPILIQVCRLYLPNNCKLSSDEAKAKLSIFLKIRFLYESWINPQY